MARLAARVLPGCAALLWSFVTVSASAEARHFRVFEEGFERGYALSIEASVRRAERTDFSRPIFFVAQTVDDIVATELRTAVDLEVAIVPWLALELELPLAYRRADVRFSPVVVSEDEILPAKWLDLSGLGVADPELSLAFRLLKTRELGLFARSGIGIPLDDDPGAPVVPSRVPASTGQAELFAGARGLVTFTDVALELDYRVGLHPGSVSTSLTRTFDHQYANGALSAFWNHDVRAGVRLLPAGPVSVGLFPGWRISESPRLVVNDEPFPFLPEAWRHEVGLELRVRLRLSKHDAVELRCRHSFVDATDRDPFFPLVMPDRGFGITWQTGGN